MNLLLLLPCLVVTAPFLHSAAGNEVIGGPVKEFPSPEDARLRIYIDNLFRENGWLTRWRYYAIRKGTFFAGVWRPDNFPLNDKGYLDATKVENWTLISKTEITAEETGIQEHWFPYAEGPSVRPGDAISVHYPEGATEFDTVVPEIHSQWKVNNQYEIRLSSVVEKDVSDDHLETNLTLKSKIKALRYGVSLSAITSNRADIGFVPGTHYSWSVGEGRVAEAGVVTLKHRNRWGTICETRMTHPSIPKSQRLAMVAEAWGNKICQAINPEDALVDIQTRTIHRLGHHILQNANCSADLSILDGCVSDQSSLQEVPCPNIQHQMVVCMPDPDRFHIEMNIQGIARKPGQ